MGKKLNPYLRHIDSYKDNSKAFYSLTRSIGLREDQVQPIYLTTDGKVIANGFVDKNDNIELYLDSITQTYLTSTSLTLRLSLNTLFHRA